MTSPKEESASDDEAKDPWQKKAFKSGKTRTANTMVVKWITWLHELFYGVDGKHAMHKELTLPLFLGGYLSVLDTVKTEQKGMMLKNLKELMADTELYG